MGGQTVTNLPQHCRSRALPQLGCTANLRCNCQVPCLFSSPDMTMPQAWKELACTLIEHITWHSNLFCLNLTFAWLPDIIFQTKTVQNDNNHKTLQGRILYSIYWHFHKVPATRYEWENNDKMSPNEKDFSAVCANIHILSHWVRSSRFIWNRVALPIPSSQKSPSRLMSSGQQLPWIREHLKHQLLAKQGANNPRLIFALHSS